MLVICVENNNGNYDNVVNIYFLFQTWTYDNRDRKSEMDQLYVNLDPKKYKV